MRRVFDPSSDEPFVLSRSKIDLFCECPRCFYMDRRRGVSRPSGPPFTLNVAVDALLKHEFDAYRESEEKHALIERFGIDARPVSHEQLHDWRENFRGIRFHHEETNFVVTGAIDDLWRDSRGKYIVVDYKATSRKEPVTQLGEGGFYDAYRRQMDVYRWLLEKNGLSVSDVGYFLYCTGKKDQPKFDGRLDFDMYIIPYVGDFSWVEPTLRDIRTCLLREEFPKPSSRCEYCRYVSHRVAQEREEWDF